MDRLLFTDKDWSTHKKLAMFQLGAGGALNEYEIEGNPAVFDTNVAKPLKELLIPFAPVQDLHGQDYPYPAGGGVNLLPPMVDGTYEGNGVKAVVSGGIATLSGTANATGNALIIPLEKSFTTPSTTAYIHMCNSAVNASVAPSFELSTDPGGTLQSPSFSPANRIVAIGENRQGVVWDRIRFYISSGVTLSGTFSPMVCKDDTVRSFAPYENICPITGWTGAQIGTAGTNVYDSSTDTSGYYFNGNGNTIANASYKITDYIPVEGSILYSGWTGGAATACIWYDENKGKVSSVFFTTGTNVMFAPATAKYIRCSLSAANDTFSLSTRHTYPISWQTEAGTVYGGNLEVKADGSCKLTATHAIKDLGSLSFSGSTPENHVFRTGNNAISDIRKQENGGLLPYAICDTFYPMAYNPISASDNGAFAIAPTSAGNKIVIIDNRFSSTSDFESAVDGVQLVYELADPLEFDLDPLDVQTLIGTNVIFTDTNGENTIKYLKKG